MKFLKKLFSIHQAKDRQSGELYIPEDHTGIFDFSIHQEVEEIYGEFPLTYKGLDSLRKLKRIKIRKFKEKDFKSFSKLKSLERLEIYDAYITSLQGLEQLQKLTRLDIEKAPKLISTEGIGKHSLNLEWLRIYNAKNLTDADSIGLIPHLKSLILSRIHQLQSIHFLGKLDELDFLFLHPDVTGVAQNDYYPLLRRLKSMGKLVQLESWKELDTYLNEEVVLQATESKTELQHILAGLSIRNWSEKLEDGMKQYTEENCNRAIKIIEELINQLESGEMTEKTKIELIKQAVLSFNALNAELDYSFIETGEREDLCDIFDNIADAVGIDVQKYDDGIAYKWRDW